MWIVEMWIVKMWNVMPSLVGLQINVAKTKLLTINTTTVDGDVVEDYNEFCYLGYTTKKFPKTQTENLQG